MPRAKHGISKQLLWGQALLRGEILFPKGRPSLIPKSGLVMYGTVGNTAADNARLITGTLIRLRVDTTAGQARRIMPAGSSPVAVTTPLLVKLFHWPGRL
jgi:hypothetical protein